MIAWSCQIMLMEASALLELLKAALCTLHADVTFTTQVESPHRMASVSSTKDAKHGEDDNGSEDNKEDQGDDDDDLSIATITDDDDDDNDGDRDSPAAR